MNEAFLFSILNSPLMIGLGNYSFWVRPIISCTNLARNFRLLDIEFLFFRFFSFIWFVFNLLSCPFTWQRDTVASSKTKSSVNLASPFAKSIERLTAIIHSVPIRQMLIIERIVFMNKINCSFQQIDSFIFRSIFARRQGRSLKGFFILTELLSSITVCDFFDWIVPPSCISLFSSRSKSLFRSREHLPFNALYWPIHWFIWLPWDLLLAVVKIETMDRLLLVSSFNGNIQWISLELCAFLPVNLECSYIEKAGNESLFWMNPLEFQAFSWDFTQKSFQWFSILRKSGQFFPNLLWFDLRICLNFGLLLIDLNFPDQILQVLRPPNGQGERSILAPSKNAILNHHYHRASISNSFRKLWILLLSCDIAYAVSNTSTIQFTFSK